MNINSKSYALLAGSFTDFIITQTEKELHITLNKKKMAWLTFFNVVFISALCLGLTWYTSYSTLFVVVEGIFFFFFLLYKLWDVKRGTDILYINRITDAVFLNR